MRSTRVDNFRHYARCDERYRDRYCGSMSSLEAASSATPSKL
jgi:hypothetical protein